MSGKKGKKEKAADGDEKRATRARLIEAAREEFKATGYRGATLDSIAARAGYTKGALYWHFPNKQAIFVSLIAEAIEENLKTVEALLSAMGSEPAAIREALGNWVDGIDERELLPLFGAELEVEARRNESFRALHQAMIGKHEESMAAFLQRYFDATGDTPDLTVQEIAATLITSLKGFALCRQNRPEGLVSSGKLLRILLKIPQR